MPFSTIQYYVIIGIVISINILVNIIQHYKLNMQYYMYNTMHTIGKTIQYYKIVGIFLTVVSTITFGIVHTTTDFSARRILCVV